MAFSRIAAALESGSTFEVFGDGTQSRDFTYVSDAVAATVPALEHAPAGSVYNVGGGAEASLREVVALAEELTGRPLRVRYGAPAAGDVRRTRADTTRIRDDLGWTPRVRLAEGLASQLEAAVSRVAA